MSGSLDRSRITRLFGELSEELERKGVRGHVYVVGGAALIAGFGRARSTRDIDGRIVAAKGEVLAAAARVGRRRPASTWACLCAVARCAQGRETDDRMTPMRGVRAVRTELFGVCTIHS